jgi:hypothetical protein
LADALDVAVNDILAERRHPSLLRVAPGKCDSAVVAKTTYDFSVGQQVVVLSRELYGARGTLLKRTHLLGKRAWLVELDLGRTDSFAIRRTRVVEYALVPASAAPSVMSDPGTRRISSARLVFTLLVPFGFVVWTFLPGPVALAVDLGVVVAAVAGFRSPYPSPQSAPPPPPAPQLPTVTAGRYWCETDGCRMYSRSVDADHCVLCGQPTMSRNRRGKSRSKSDAAL